MSKLIKFETSELPKLYLAGKELRYNMEAHMKGDNRIPAFWEKCFADEVFSTLEKQQEFIFDSTYVGVMLDWNQGDGDFSYVCGMLFNEDVTVPEGFFLREIDATKVGIGWIQGKDTADVCSNAHVLTEQAIKDADLDISNMKWCMELYNCPRFTTPDENGEIILDYYIPCENKSL